MKRILTILSITSILFTFNCQEEASGDDPGALLLLLNSESSQVAASSTGGNCAIQENAVSTSGSPTVTLVNASSTRCWMLVSLRNGGTQVAPDANNWDLRFRRFVIGTNSGQSGTGNGAACDTGSTDFNAISSGSLGNCATASNFKVDSIQTQSGTGGNADVNDSASPVLFEWYTYKNTRLTAKNNVYIIRGSDGTSLFKLQMTNYYSDAGTSGYPRFRWAAL